ncbi:hypothetical protein TNCV_4506521 [Trichonephila clavipes]|nr:hypothetical protein TNCV_4506521 [Trichonephila clavipes]
MKVDLEMVPLCCDILQQISKRKQKATITVSARGKQISGAVALPDLDSRRSRSEASKGHLQGHAAVRKQTSSETPHNGKYVFHLIKFSFKIKVKIDHFGNHWDGFSEQCIAVALQSCGRGSLELKVTDRGWLVTSSSPVSVKTCRVGERCTLNLSRAQTSSRWCGS